MSREYAVVPRPRRTWATLDEAVSAAEGLLRVSGRPHTVVLCLSTVAMARTVHLADPPVALEELP